MLLSHLGAAPGGAWNTQLRLETMSGVVQLLGFHWGWEAAGVFCCAAEMGTEAQFLEDTELGLAGEL